MHFARIRTFLLLALLMLGGCASVQPISDADRKAVTSVAISPSVTKAPDMYYLGPGMTAGLMFGAVGALVAAPAMERSRKAFEEYTAKHGISLERIVLEEVEGALRRAGKMPLGAQSGPGAAVLHVAVPQWGFSVPHGFSGMLVPILYIRCELKDAQGKLLWSSSERVLPLGNPVEALTPEAVRSDPKAMADAWRGAARHIAAEIAKTY